MVGMFVYDISNPGSPVQQGTFTHARACDPVVADDNFAYVTLREGTSCGPTDNELDVINVQNLPTTSLVKKYPMINPAGLAKDGNLLFICDGIGGLRVYNAAVPQNLQLVRKISNIETYDVIAYNNKAIVVAKDGLYQYQYTSNGSIYQVSKLAVQK
jgi:hypothetical protein